VIREILIQLVVCASLVLAAGCGPGEPRSGPKLYVFDCGEIFIPSLGKLISPGIDVGVSKRLFVPCYLVDHPEGRLLFDAGLSDSLAEFGEEGVWSGDRDFQSIVKRTLKAQLEALNVDSLAIELVAFSHLHFDHAGNGNLFRKARWLVQEPEFEAGFAPDAREHFFDPASYAELRDRAVLLNGDHDVFGDGSVMLLSTPGHTPGHQVLFVNLRNYGPLILSGDLWHTAKNHADSVVPAFNHDREQTLESMERISGVLADEQATLWIEHEPPGVALAPAFVD
jgi:glyoxylase-like metal-dependent hydrolase (beta-lactamase superfamily II)